MNVNFFFLPFHRLVENYYVGGSGVSSLSETGFLKEEETVHWGTLEMTHFLGQSKWIDY